MLVAERADFLPPCGTQAGMFSEDLSADHRWYLLRTRARQEKIVARELANRRVLHFLPLVRATRYYAGRKATVELPLFPGNVFLRGILSDAYSLDCEGRLAQIIEIRNQKQVHHELKNIDFALSKATSLSMFRYVREGIRVEVRAGPLKGLRGVIESLTRQDRIILQVEILAQSVSAELDGSILDVIQ